VQNEKPKAEKTFGWDVRIVFWGSRATNFPSETSERCLQRTRGLATKFAEEVFRKLRFWEVTDFGQALRLVLWSHWLTWQQNFRTRFVRNVHVNQPRALAATFFRSKVSDIAWGHWRDLGSEVFEIDCLTLCCFLWVGLQLTCQVKVSPSISVGGKACQQGFLTGLSFHNVV
jgi:hypothetical protein